MNARRDLSPVLGHTLDPNGNVAAGYRTNKPPPSLAFPLFVAEGFHCGIEGN